MKPIFYQKCHKRIMPPSFLNNVNIQGNINLNCTDSKCKGIAKIKPKENNPK